MNNKNNTPQLILVCGCNGAGKSTYTYSTLENEQHIIYVDPDRIAKEENCSPMQAGRIALTRTKEFLDSKQNFLKESTLSSQSDLKLIQEAQEKGFHVSMTYVGLESADYAVQRVSDRHKKGGHTVPEEDIRRRYERSIENLPKAIALANKIRIVDNSKNDYQHVATFENGQLKEQNSSPVWFKKAEQTLGISFQSEKEKTQTTQGEATKTYLDIPKVRELGDAAKEAGAKWDKDEKSWYIMSDNPKKEELIDTINSEKEKQTQAKKGVGVSEKTTNATNNRATSTKSDKMSFKP